MSTTLPTSIPKSSTAVNASNMSTQSARASLRKRRRRGSTQPGLAACVIQSLSVLPRALQASLLGKHIGAAVK